MTTAPDTEPLAAAPGSPDLPSHLVCCNANRSLCGLDMRAGKDLSDAAALDCVVCDGIDAAGIPCGGLFCLTRQWLRERFGRRR